MVNYEQLYQDIKQKIMREWGYDEEDMGVEDIEEAVNRETDKRFEEETGIDHNDLSD